MKLFFKSKGGIILLLIFFVNLNLVGQDSTSLVVDPLNLLPSPCFLPKIEVQSEIKTMTETKVVYLKFEENIPDFFTIRQQDGIEIVQHLFLRRKLLSRLSI